MEFVDERVLRGTPPYGSEDMGEISPYLSERDLETAWRTWVFRDHGFPEIDDWVLPLLPLSPHRPWLKQAREISAIPIRELAKRLEVHPSTYKKFEKAEEEKKISIASLERCADALKAMGEALQRGAASSVFSKGGAAAAMAFFSDSHSRTQRKTAAILGSVRVRTVYTES